jgi:heme exporter protein A
MPEDNLEVQNLHVWRGERHVLRGVQLRLSGGMYLEVTGANGAGKTSLLRSVCGLIYPEEGRILWGGQDVRRDLPGFQSQLAYLGHEPPLKGDLSALENLRYWIGMRRPLEAPAVEEVLTRVGAGAYRERLVRTLSAGQRRRVALAGLALLALPLWVLDEPATHLDAAGQQLVATLIAEQLARGGMVMAAVHQSLAMTIPAVRRLELAST